MPLRVQPGNWEKFIQRYRRDPSQWYLIPKAKTYDEEFKRDQTSDQAVGQVLRYMGWVRKHLSPSKNVRGYVIASDFDRLIRYSLIGMQHPEIPNRHGKDLIQLHRHGFDPARVGRVSIDELSG